jgi:hypothetical protein
MYESYYGLNSKPFQLTPDPAFFFASKWHKRAMSYLQYGLSQAEGFIVITGGIGTGKTTVANSLLEELEDDIYYRKSDLLKAQKLAQQLHGASAADMEMKIAKMQKEIDNLESKFERATSQAQITKAGYIYVISNIGSFGEGIVKIGMTRRLEPMDRVSELGDASVPFKFDVHTLTFVDDAPKVEKILHLKFNDKRVNIENLRREFFRVSPQEVAKAMEELNIDCDWYFDAEAKEFRESLLIRKAFKKEESNIQSVSNQLPSSI